MLISIWRWPLPTSLKTLIVTHLLPLPLTQMSDHAFWLCHVLWDTMLAEFRIALSWQCYIFPLFLATCCWNCDFPEMVYILASHRTFYYRHNFLVLQPSFRYDRVIPCILCLHDSPRGMWSSICIHLIEPQTVPKYYVTRPLFSPSYTEWHGLGPG